MEALLVTLLVLLLAGLCGAALFVVVAVLIARRLVAAARQGRDAVRLRVTAYCVGTRAETAAMRLTLQREMDAANRALSVAQVQRWPLGDTPALLRQLQLRADAVDAHLRVVEGEPRPEVARAALAAIHPDVVTVARAAADLREGLRAGGLRLTAPDLRSLARDCAVEKRALRAS